MPSRLSGIFSRSSKEQEAKAEEAANHSNGHSSDPVPHYSASEAPPPDYQADDDTVAPPDYTAGFANLSISDAPSSGIPSVDETIAHLKTLECFSQLRQSIASTDGLFGIDNAAIVEIARASSLVSGEGADELLPRLAEKRWAVYISRAVDRFYAWISAAVPDSTMPTMAEMERDGSNDRITNPSYVKTAMPPIGRSNMPPLDVLMVWHSYMLNPRAYLEDCVRLGRMALWNTKMPWNAIAECIDPSTFIFQAGDVAEGAFTRLTGHYVSEKPIVSEGHNTDVNRSIQWDNLIDGDAKKLNCPSCQANIHVPWTTCCQHTTEKPKSDRNLAENVDAVLASGEGFSDRDFSATCPGCEIRITHDLLRADKFCTDVRQLLTKGTPMPGTILGLRGLPFRFGIYHEVKWYSVYNKVNNLLLFGLGQRILDQPRLGGEGFSESISGIRDMIGETIEGNHKYMRTVRDSASHRMTRLERVGFRKMMSRYWENSSAFALDLVGAVVRQGGFIEKMHNIDWLHSPALPATMTRLILKYERFVDIMEDATNMAVPTLDVDLAWHTHQLNPPSYMKYVVNKTRQFVDHDDKVAETALNDAFAWTCKTYEKKYGGKYSECTCWYCESVREQNTSTASRIFSSKGKQSLHDTEQDPKKSIHISAHNAVCPTDDAQYTAEAQAQADKLEAAYRKACERAKKKGTKAPGRDDYYWSTAYGRIIVSVII